MSAGHRKKLISESALLYLATCLAIFFRFVGGFLTAGLLGPALYGIRTVFGLITRYEVYSHAGTLDGMRREVSYNRGRNDEAQAEAVMGNVFAANGIYAGVAAVVLLLAAVYMRLAGYEVIYADFAIFLAVHIALDKLRSFYTVRLTADKRADVLGRTRVMFEFLTAALGAVFIYFWSLRGLLIGLILAEAITVAYMLRAVRWVPQPRLSLPVLWPLVRTGIPIMLTGLAFLLLKSVDQIIIAVRLPHEMLGYFGFAVIVGGLIYMALSDVMSAIFFSRMMEKAGAMQDVTELQDYLVQPTLLVAYSVPFLMGAAYLAVHLPIEYLLTEYVPALGITKVLILGSFFYSTSVMPLMLCIALNRQVQMLLMTFAAVAMNAAFSWSLISLGFGIAGVAVGTVVAHLLFSVATIAYVYAHFRKPFVDCARFLGMVYLPFVYAAALLWLLERAQFFVPAGFWSEVALALAQFALYCLAFALILLPMRRQPVFVELADSIPNLRRRAPQVEMS